MNWPNFYYNFFFCFFFFFFGFLILFENLYILRIILGYGNDKLRDGALSISYLRRHPYVLLP